MKSTSFGGFSSKSTIAPGTLGLMIALVLFFLINWAMIPNQPLLMGMALNTAEWLQKPWTLLTYPFAIPGSAIFSILFATFWLWSVGTQVERQIGLGSYLGAFFGFGLLGSSLVLAGSAVAGPYILYTSVIPAGCITMLWGARNSNQVIHMCGIVPIRAAIFCFITVVLSFLSLGMGKPLIGLMAILPMGLAWLWASNRLPLRYPVGSAASAGARRSAAEAKREREQFSAYIGDVREREMERKEKDRLREIFERSLIDDPDDQEKRG